MSEQPLNDLIQKYLNDTLSADEFRELQRQISADPAAGDAFALACRMDAALAEHFAQEKQVETSSVLARRAVAQVLASDDYLPARPRRSRSRLAWFTAAALLIAAGAGVWFAAQHRIEPTPNIGVHRLLSGRALIDGREDQPIHDGSRVEALDEPAVIALSDGSQAQLAPSSEALLRGPVGAVRQVVALTRGGGIFRVEKGRRQFRVETPVGNITVLGTEFEVRLQKFHPNEGDNEMLMRTFLTLAVLVSAGNVEVEVNGRLHTLTAGQNQVFADDREAKSDSADFNRKADVTGRFLKYDEKLGTLLVAGEGRGAKGNITFAVAKDVKVFSDKKDAKLGDIPEDQLLMLYLNDDKSTVLAVRFGAKADVVRREGDNPGQREGQPEVSGRLVEFDAKNNTLKILRGGIL